MNKKVVGIGETVWDIFPSGKRLGGAPVNFAFFAKEFGAEAYPVSAVGDDAPGDEAMEALDAAGLRLGFIQRNSNPTGRVLVKTDGTGVPRYEIVEGVAWDSMSCDDRTLALLGDADVVCWGTLAQRSPQSRASIMKMVAAAPSRSLKVFDINLRQHYFSREIVEESLKCADLLKLNEDELPAVSELFSLEGDVRECVCSLVRRFSLSNVIYTCGSVCSEVYGAEGLLSHLDTPKVNVTDTVGAGDSFTATYVMARLGGASVTEAHALAVEVSAFVCTRSGAINPLPECLRTGLCR